MKSSSIGPVYPVFPCDDIRDIVEAHKASLGLKFLKEFRSESDFIQFSHRDDLVKEIRASGYMISIREMSETENIISTVFAKIFFDSIVKLQKSGTDIPIPKTPFEEILKRLKEMQFLTQENVESIKSEIKILPVPSLNEYKEKAELTRDVKMALSLACYYRNNPDVRFSSSSAFWWLCQAKDYLNGESLGEVMNLEEFLQGFQIVDTIYPFFRGREEIADACARCPTIKTLDPYPTGYYTPETTKSIGSFLRLSTSVENVNLSGGEERRIDSDNVTPIAEALTTNTSIKLLSLFTTDLDAKGIRKVISAIGSNPNSGITTLEFCKMSKAMGEEFVEWLRAKEQITHVGVGFSRFSSAVEEEIVAILKERNIG